MKAFAGEGIGQSAERTDGDELAACPIDGASKAFRAPTRRDVLRVAPGTLEEPSAGTQPPGGSILVVRSLGHRGIVHGCQREPRVSTARHRQVNDALRLGGLERSLHPHPSGSRNT